MRTEFGDRKTLLMLCTVSLVTLMCGLDGSVINIMLPTIAKDFDIDAAVASWITISYFVMMAGLLLIFAHSAKNGMVKKILLGGIVLFTLSSLSCGISTSFEMLLLSRFVQGAGAAMMASTAPMVCVRHLPAGKLALGLTFITIGSSLGFTIGPALGGFIIDVLSWHWIFLINLPIGLITISLLMYSVPKDSGHVKTKSDFLGAFLLLLSFLFGVLLLEGRALFDNLTEVFGIAFVISLSLFIVVELKRENPILNVRVFKHHRFNAAYVSFILDNVGYMGLMYIVPFFMIVCLDLSYAVSGIILLIPSLITLFTCMPIARWSDEHGRWLPCLISITAIMLPCLIMFIFANSTSLVPLIVSVVLMGISWAFYGGPMMSRVIETVEGESREMASSLMNEGVYTGSVLGSTTFALMFSIGAGAGNVSLVDLEPSAFIEGMIVAMIFGTITGIIGMVLSALVKDKKKESGQ